MDFKYINDKNKTPNAKCSSSRNCDSPFRFLPNSYSTPPSRFSKILNPFDSHHIIDSLHLPTFSPSVFATVTTPNKPDDKFKWSIDEISNLKPADIDEGTISQHVFLQDPHTESLVQQKLEKFFSEKSIVPSPMVEVERVPLVNIADGPIEDADLTVSRLFRNRSTQTVLTLPAILPEALEKQLQPFLTYTEDQQKTDCEKIENTSLYHDLFEAKTPYSEKCTPESSPALSTGLSPIDFPLIKNQLTKRDSSNPNLSVLSECNLSPIMLNKSSKDTLKSVCRLDFSSAGMSVDASMIVPNLENQAGQSQFLVDENSPPPAELLSDSTVNWDMEYQHVSLASPSSEPDMDKMDISNSNTPHSKIFPSQRKRLSDSFKDEDEYFDKENESPPQVFRQTRKIFKNDVTDAGYHTESGTYFNDSSLPIPQVFASTPSKHKPY